MQILVVGVDRPVLAHLCWCSLCDLGHVNCISVIWHFSSCKMVGDGSYLKYFKLIYIKVQLQSIIVSSDINDG